MVNMSSEKECFFLLFCGSNKIIGNEARLPQAHGSSGAMVKEK